MSRTQTLEKLASLIESFLEQVVVLKEKRLSVLEGINRLDDIARQKIDDINITDGIGDWFAQHNRWLTENNLKPADINRISGILEKIKTELKINPDSSPAENKISAEISRWAEKVEPVKQKIILKRTSEKPEVYKESGMDTISLFSNNLSRLADIYKDYCQGKIHILSVLDDLLQAAKLQKNKDTLILSGFIIYYLRRNDYKVEPYIKKLKEAETIILESSLNA